MVCRTRARSVLTCFCGVDFGGRGGANLSCCLNRRAIACRFCDLSLTVINAKYLALIRGGWGSIMSFALNATPDPEPIV
jgi:hypothetical protein